MKKLANKYRIAFYFILFSCGLIISFVFADMTFFSGQLKKTAINNAHDKIMERERFLQTYFENASNTLEATSTSKYFNKYLTNPKKYKNELKDIFLSIVKMNNDIMQFRYINKDGKEKVRVGRYHYNDKTVYSNNSYLQDKSNRYYFKDSITKPLNKVWFSDIDLNMERGLIQKPYAPTLRAILPLSKNGKFAGVLIINYFMKNTLENFKDTSLYDLILVNEKLETLQHYMEEKSWSAYKEDFYTIKEEFPLRYKTITSNKLYKTNDFVSKELDLDTPNKLFLVLQLKKSYIGNSQKEKLSEYAVVSFIVFILSFFFSIVFSKYMKRLIYTINDTKKINRTLGEVVEDKTKKLKELNENLEKRIEEEIQKNKVREKHMFNQSKMASMGDMIGNIAHQWRQPLSLISTAASGIKLNYEFGMLDMNHMLKDLDSIIDKTQYLSRTIDTFRNYLSDNNEYAEINLQKNIQNSLAIVQASLDDKYIEVKNNINALSIIRINTISTELSEVIINILNNAKDALSINEIKNPWIDVSINKDNEFVYIYIEDNAGGIDKSIIGRVFEPYFTTKHKRQGTGLGLHISYRIVIDSLHGDISVMNSTHGAKFCLKLPFA